MSQLSRREELEIKKQKLAAIREAKKQKEEEKKKKALEEEAAETSTSARAEAEQLLKELGIQPTVQAPASVPSSAASAESADKQDDAAPVSKNVAAKEIKLSVSKVCQTEFAPKEIIVYTKETQTPGEQAQQTGGAVDYYVLTYDDLLDETDSQESGLMGGRHHSAASSASHKMPHPEQVQPPKKTQDQQEKKDGTPAAPPPRDLTEEERVNLMKSNEFTAFLERASLVMERALDENENLPDIFVDYGRDDDDQDQDREARARGQLHTSKQFECERWSRGKLVNALDWSPQFPELLAASYTACGGGGGTSSLAAPHASHDPDGVVLVWNSRFKNNTPEYVFHVQSSVVSVCFARFHPHLVIGGTYSGQVVVWDNRTNKRTPVQSSPLSSTAHTQPVYCSTVVGSQNAHNLITCSTDGRLCSWSLDMLSQPQDTLDLQHPKFSRPVNVMAMCFPAGDVNNLVVGAEDGSVVSACRHGAKAGVVDIFEPHYAPVSGIHTNPVQGQIDFSHLFLTSSFDWTARLWNMKEQRPLCSFEESRNYVADVQWSPIHPALFATGDINGELSLWNINADTEIPYCSTNVNDGPAGAGILKLRWTLSGHQVAVGDDLGKIHLYDVPESLCMPRVDEGQHLLKSLAELKQQRADSEVLNPDSLAPDVLHKADTSASPAAASIMVPGVVGSPLISPRK